MFSLAIALGGLVFTAAYAFATSGPHWRFVGVGILVAFAALTVGCLFGFLFGIPRVVSSGQLRIQAVAPAPKPASGNDSTTPPADSSAADSSPDPLTGSVDEQQPVAGTAPTDGASATPAPADGAGSVGSTFAPSTNLAEVSDWLTKLLLGAGLVSLSSLRGPIGDLIGQVAAGLDNTKEVQGPAKVIAGAIMITYVVLGFLDGYIVTTLWYQKRLDLLQRS